MTDLTTRVWIQSLGMGMGRCQASNPTRPMGRLPAIMSYVLILLKAHLILLSILSHTQQHTSSKQHDISHPKTLTYIYHDNSYQTQHTFIMHIISFNLRQPTNKISQGQKHRHGSKVLKSNITQTFKHSIEASNKQTHCAHHPKCIFM